MLRRHRLPLVALGVLALGGMLAGCAPDPAPTPSPTPAFASDEEAFAAAEKVYRAYNDAGNARNAGLDAPDPQEFLVGRALEADIEGVRLLDTNDLEIAGAAKISKLDLSDVKLRGRQAEIKIIACLDVSSVSLLDTSGQDVTPPDRPDTVAQEVTLEGQNGNLLISLEESARTDACS